MNLLKKATETKHKEEGFMNRFGINKQENAIHTPHLPVPLLCLWSTVKCVFVTCLQCTHTSDLQVKGTCKWNLTVPSLQILVVLQPHPPSPLGPLSWTPERKPLVNFTLPEIQPRKLSLYRLNAVSLVPFFKQLRRTWIKRKGEDGRSPSFKVATWTKYSLF